LHYEEALLYTVKTTRKGGIEKEFLGEFSKYLTCESEWVVFEREMSLVNQ